MFADYDQYYASLAASAVTTPAVPTLGDDFGDDDEDVKPSLEYLDSLNEHNKRSRSHEDVDGGLSLIKTPRLNGHESVHETSPAETPAQAPEDEEAVAASADEPVVYGE